MRNFVCDDFIYAFGAFGDFHACFAKCTAGLGRYLSWELAFDLQESGFRCVDEILCNRAHLIIGATAWDKVFQEALYIGVTANR